MKLIKQAAALPFRFRNGVIELLLVQTRSGNKWTIPKGIIDPGFTPQQTAIEESFEEAGLHGIVYSQQYAQFSYQKWQSTCEVTIFILRVKNIHDAWPEKEWRQRRWISSGDDLSIVKYKSLEKIIAEFLSDKALHLKLEKEQL
jgi:8-oxo-dGTP pyrophosphatase MutT (NUDIX family)